MLAPTENTSGRRGNASPTQTDEPGDGPQTPESGIGRDASSGEIAPPGATSAGPDTGFSFGAGLKVRSAKGFHTLSEWTPAALADGLSELDPDKESWFAPHRWRDNRRKGDHWLSASCAVCDLDWHDSAGKHAALPHDRADALTLAMLDGKLPGALGHLTPRGARVIAPLLAPVTDANEYRRACEGLARLCVDALAALGEPLAEARRAGFKADVTHDLARVFRAPNCAVAGEANPRRESVLVWRDTPCAVADLLAAAPDVPVTEPAATDAPADCAYQVTPGGFVWLKPTRDGHVPLTLTNWTARIVAQVTRDDGSGQPARTLEVQAEHAGRRTAPFTIPAAQLANVRKWAVEHLGTNAVVFPGFNAEAHVQAALQLTSGETPTRVVFTHTGWRQVAGQRVYLHTAGGIGADGARDDIETDPQGLALYRLPDPPQGDALRDAVAASLRLLEVAPGRVALPLFALPWRAVLGKCDATVFLNGRTGTRKSEL
ncbi:MAG: hypothetical protein KJ044_13765, partial [Planctomycetes bacterium]|nr:hypothetical protein [Planctomycetota bacterium]